MILVDTSIWIDHLRNGDAGLARLLEDARVAVHPFVIGEIALGNLRARDDVLATLTKLPHAVVASNEEVLHFVAIHSLSGLGIGLIDVHLLAATRLTADLALWTRDKKLLTVASRLGMAAAIP